LPILLKANLFPKIVKPIESFKNKLLQHKQITTLFISVCFFFSSSLSEFTPFILIDPKFGQAAGFGGVILHGLSTFGFASRAVLKSVRGSDSNPLEFFGVRFTTPVKPGDKLEIGIWEVGKGPNGTVEVAFEIKNLRLVSHSRWSYSSC
jgi:hypothetical protein